MPTLSKFLVAVDFSEYSERALAFAEDLAASLGASIHLVHVYPLAAYVAPPMTPAPVLVGQFREQSEQAFREYLTRVRKEHGVPFEGTLAEGVPHEEIVKVAKSLGADLIVMGTHGRSGIEHLLLGSVAERVIRVAGIPVLTVPKPS